MTHPAGDIGIGAADEQCFDTLDPGLLCTPFGQRFSMDLSNQQFLGVRFMLNPTEELCQLILRVVVLESCAIQVELQEG